MAKSSGVSALKFLLKPKAHAPTPITVVCGDHLFLKHETLKAIKEAYFDGDEEESIAITRLTGSEIEYRDVVDALSSISLFGGSKRMVIVRDADFSKSRSKDAASFLKQCRPQLEEYATKPFHDAVLVLEVKTWLKTTRLAKQLQTSGGLVLDCASPDPNGNMPAGKRKEVRDWLKAWAKKQHRFEMSASIIDAMMDLVGLEPGLLDQETAKLVGLCGGDAKALSLDLVMQSVGNWRTRTAWDMIDATASGNASEALAQLDRLLSAGEVPQAILPMLGATLRKFAVAGKLYLTAEKLGRRASMQQVLKDAGMLPFKLREAETQFRQIGRDRASHLLQWIMEADIAIKETHSAPERARQVIEQLIAKLSKQCRPEVFARR